MNTLPRGIRPAISGFVSFFSLGKGLNSPHDLPDRSRRMKDHRNRVHVGSVQNPVAMTGRTDRCRRHLTVINPCRPARSSGDRVWSSCSLAGGPKEGDASRHRRRRRSRHSDRERLRPSWPQRPLRRHRSGSGRCAAGRGLRRGRLARPARPADAGDAERAHARHGRAATTSARSEQRRAAVGERAGRGGGAARRGRALHGAARHREQVVGPDPGGARRACGWATTSLVASNPEFLRAVGALEDFLMPWMTVVGSRQPADASSGSPSSTRPFGGELRTLHRPGEGRVREVRPQHLQRHEDQLLERDLEGRRAIGVDADEVAADGVPARPRRR